MDQLLSIDLAGAFRRLGAVMVSPTSNPIVASLLIGVISLFVVILLVLALMFVIGRPEADEEEEEDEDIEEYENMYPIVAKERVEEEEGQEAPPAVVAPAKRPRAKWTVVSLGITIAVGLAIWVSTGYVTSQSTLCLSCHANSAHAKAARTDPHSAVACVSCHESGGTFGALTYMVAPRGIHFVSGILSATVTDGYSRSVPSSACSRCHASVIAQTATIKAQGVRVSHKEPLAAGAQCVDCHALVRGAVSTTTVGMATCLRCHDNHTASSACKTCHIGDIGDAATPSAETTVTPQDLVGTPNCYTCHDPKPCDACHGIRLPHTVEFMKHGHARAAAVDFWHNNGKVCSRCHTATRNSCSRCHADMPAHGYGLDWAKLHQTGNPNACSTGCHGNRASNGTRSMCSFCHDPSVGPVTPLPGPVTPGG